MFAVFRKGGLPDELMRDVLWNFNEDRFVDEAAFVVALREYNESIKGKVTFDPDVLVLDSPSVTIQYEYWVEVDGEDDSIEDTVDLAADNGRSFRQAELLFKVHNAICTRVAEGDHTFFEGFSRWKGSRRSSVPLYFVTLGS